MNALWLLLACCSVSLGYKSDIYKGYQHIVVVPGTVEEITLLREIQLEGKVEFWNDPIAPGRSVNVLVAPQEVNSLTASLNQGHLEFTVRDSDLSIILEEQWTRLSQKESQVYDYDDFNLLEDVYTEIDVLAAQCTGDLVCGTSSVGQSLEGREIQMMTISRAANTEAFFMDSTIHAREWLATATTMRIFRDMIRDYASGDPVATKFMSFNWYFVPVVNPDGYDYTWTDDRFWRKNRRVNAHPSCMGVDLNRNFDFDWSGPGASSNPCDETFYGTAPASEPEVQVMQALISNVAATENLRTLWTVHTYGEYMLYPYGDCGLTSPVVDDLVRLTGLICDAIEATPGSGTWRCGQMCQTLYPTSGITIDWAHDTPGIPYVWTPELRGNGFAPPASEIVPSVTELTNGLMALLNDLQP